MENAGDSASTRPTLASSQSVIVTDWVDDEKPGYDGSGINSSLDEYIEVNKKKKRTRQHHGKRPNPYCPTNYREGRNWCKKSSTQSSYSAVESSSFIEECDTTQDDYRDEEIIKIPRQRYPIPPQFPSTAPTIVSPVADLRFILLNRSNAVKIHKKKKKKKKYSKSERDGTLTKKSIAKALKQHQREQKKKRKELEKRGTSRTDFGKSANEGGILLNGVILPNFSVSHGWAAAAHAAAASSAPQENHVQLIGEVRPGSATTVSSTVTSENADIDPVAANEAYAASWYPYTSYGLAVPALGLNLPPPPNYPYPLICNVPDHCHYPTQTSTTGYCGFTYNMPGTGASTQPGGFQADVNIPANCRSSNTASENAVIPQTANCSTAYKGPYEDTSESGRAHEDTSVSSFVIQPQLNTEDNWQALSAVLPYISDATEYIEESGMDEVEEIHILDEDFTGDQCVDAESADFVIQQCDVAPPPPQPVADEPEGTNVTTGISNAGGNPTPEFPCLSFGCTIPNTSIAVPSLTVPHECNQLPDLRGLLAERSKQMGDYYHGFNNQHLSRSTTAARTKIGESVVTDSNYCRTMYAQETTGAQATVTTNKSNTSRLIKTKALEILCILEQQDPMEAVWGICVYMNWDRPLFQIVVCSRDDCNSKTYRCRITLRGTHYGPYEAERSEKLAKIKAAERCVQELKNDLLQFLNNRRVVDYSY